MASYKDIQGFNIQNLSSDPIPFAQEKENNPYQGTWSSGGNLNTARGAGGSMGTQTAALITGGLDPLSSPGVYGQTESYNGSAWTEVADLNTARRSNSGTGTQTAAITSGSVVNPSTVGGETESWNGSIWTSVNSLNTARGSSNTFLAGTQSASLHISGQTSPTTFLTNVESWDGTNWTEITDVNTARRLFAGAGTQTSALITGGNIPSSTESWNGTSWTEVADLNTSRTAVGGCGTSNISALVFGGDTPPVTGATESWNGTSWTEVNDLSTARQNMFSAGTSTTALAAGAEPSSTTATEEWAFTGIPPTAPAAGYTDAIVGQIYYNTSTGSFKAIKDGGAPIGTWASGGNMNTARYRMMGGAGTLTAGLVVGGYDTGLSDAVESYNGTSWTTSTSFPITAADIGMTGIATASLAIGGNGPGDNTNGVYNFNGSSWTATTSLPSVGARIKAIGTQTAALAATGEADPGQTPTNRTLEFDGTTWTTGGNYPISTNNGGCSGTQTAGFGFGGNTPPQVVAAYYDGTSWTTVTSLNTAKTESMFSGSGTQTNSMIARTTTTEAWNGTSWTEVSDLSTSRSAGGSFGTTSAMVAAGGVTPPGAVATTEEWTAADFTINTLTTS